MIKKITVITDVSARSFSEFEWSDYELSLSALCPDVKSDMRLTFAIEFQDKIQQVRSSGYEWSEDFDYYIAGPLSPKIIQLSNGQLIQGNCNLGFWEVDKKKNTLFWKLNPQLSTLVVNYKGANNSRDFKEYFNTIVKEIKLLFPRESALEWSRSVIPFSAVACFTDHCDFDTKNNLKTLRELFRETGIRTTKGFFLNHFSKRAENASWENDSDELAKWIADGHELAYHSLSQSLKTDAESFKDFQRFTAPLDTVATWIDHGFQPYNLSLWSRSGRSIDEFFSKMNSQSIRVFWNYLDSGTSSEGVLNQLSPKQFTLQSYFKGLQKLSLNDQAKLGIKNVLFHYYADEQLVENYKVLASKFKSVVKQKNVSAFVSLIKSVFTVFIPLLRVILCWTKAKKTIYPLAKYNPIFFSIAEEKSRFTIFQTLEMTDFIASLSKSNLDSLVNENGFFVAHTYFSVNLNYHKGRILLTDDEVNADVLKNFQYLGDLIKNEKIWNPTLIELTNYLKNSEALEFFVNKDGNILTDANHYHIRSVT